MALEIPVLLSSFSSCLAVRTLTRDARSSELAQDCHECLLRNHTALFDHFLKLIEAFLKLNEVSLKLFDLGSQVFLILEHSF